MNKSFDVIVAKEYETRQDGQIIKKTAWNRSVCPGRQNHMNL